MLRKNCKTQLQIRMWADRKLKIAQSAGTLNTPQFRSFMDKNACYLEGVYLPPSGVYVGFKPKTF
jgi:hypothetical protein